MKKRFLPIIIALLVATLVLGLCSCSKNAIIDPSDNTAGLPGGENTPPSDENNGGNTDTPGGDTPGTDNPGNDTPGTDTPGTDKPGTDTPGGDTPGTDNPGTDTPGTDKPGTDTPGTDKPGTDKPDDPTDPDTPDGPVVEETVEQMLAKLIFSDRTFTYDGTRKALALEGTLPEGITVKYFGNNISVAGVHTVTAKFYENGIYMRGKDRNATLTINKARYDMSDISFYDRTLPYDGKAKNLQIVGELPDGVTVNYVGNGQTAVGTYTITAKFSGNTTNYHPIPDMTATLKIYYTSIEGIEFKSKSFVYDGTPKYIYIDGTLPEGVTVSYEGNGQTAAGSYEVVASFHSELEQYKDLPAIKATLKIDKANYNVENITFESAEYLIDGMPKYLYVSGDLHPNIKVTYKGNGKVGIGEHIVTAHFTYLDSDNFNIPDLTEMSATLHIYFGVNSSDGLKYALNEDGYYSVTGYEGSQNFVVVPNTYGGKRVTGIAAEAFASSGLEYVHIGKYVTSIGEYAFRNSSVKEVDFAGKVDTIGKYAFVSSKLEKIVIPDTVTHIKEGTFMNCKALTNVYLPSSVTVVSDGGAFAKAPFYGCTGDLMIALEDKPAVGYGQYWCNVTNTDKALVVPFISYDEYENNEDEIRNQSTSDATLQKIYVEGIAIADFNSETLDYTVSFDTALGAPAVTSYASSALAAVSITQPSAENGYKATVTVTSADGAATLTYTVTFVTE